MMTGGTPMETAIYQGIDPINKQSARDLRLQMLKSMEPKEATHWGMMEFTINGYRGCTKKSA